MSTCVCARARVSVCMCISVRGCECVCACVGVCVRVRVWHAVSRLGSKTIKLKDKWQCAVGALAGKRI